MVPLTRTNLMMSDKELAAIQKRRGMQYVQYGAIGFDVAEKDIDTLLAEVALLREMVNKLEIKIDDLQDEAEVRHEFN